MAERFKITWLDGNYRVSIPNYDGGEVVDAASFDVLVKALQDIKQATLDGRVCDDVAWFDTITTLHDFCELTLDAVSTPGEPS